MSALQVIPRSPAIDAEVSGLDLAEPLADGELAVLKEAWTKHLVGNRCAQHMALWDYYPHTRSGYPVDGGRRYPHLEEDAFSHSSRTVARASTATAPSSLTITGFQVQLFQPFPGIDREPAEATDHCSNFDAIKLRSSSDAVQNWPQPELGQQRFDSRGADRRRHKNYIVHKLRHQPTETEQHQWTKLWIVDDPQYHLGFALLHLGHQATFKRLIQTVMNVVPSAAELVFIAQIELYRAPHRSCERARVRSP